MIRVGFNINQIKDEFVDLIYRSDLNSKELIYFKNNINELGDIYFDGKKWYGDIERVKVASVSGGLMEVLVTEDGYNELLNKNIEVVILPNNTLMERVEDFHINEYAPALYVGVEAVYEDIDRLKQLSELLDKNYKYIQLVEDNKETVILKYILSDFWRLPFDEKMVKNKLLEELLNDKLLKKIEILLFNRDRLIEEVQKDINIPKVDQYVLIDKQIKITVFLKDLREVLENSSNGKSLYFEKINYINNLVKEKDLLEADQDVFRELVNIASAKMLNTNSVLKKIEEQLPQWVISMKHQRVSSDYLNKNSRKEFYDKIEPPKNIEELVVFFVNYPNIFQFKINRDVNFLNDKDILMRLIDELSNLENGEDYLTSLSYMIVDKKDLVDSEVKLKLLKKKASYVDLSGFKEGELNEAWEILRKNKNWNLIATEYLVEANMGNEEKKLVIKELIKLNRQHKGILKLRVLMEEGWCRRELIEDLTGEEISSLLIKSQLVDSDFLIENIDLVKRAIDVDSAVYENLPEELRLLEKIGLWLLDKEDLAQHLGRGVVSISEDLLSNKNFILTASNEKYKDKYITLLLDANEVLFKRKDFAVGFIKNIEYNESLLESINLREKIIKNFGLKVKNKNKNELSAVLNYIYIKINQLKPKEEIINSKFKI